MGIETRCMGLRVGAMRHVLSGGVIHLWIWTLRGVSPAFVSKGTMTLGMR